MNKLQQNAGDVVMSGKLDFTKCLANPEWRIACIVWNALPLSYKIRFRIVCFQKDRILNRFHGKPHYNLFLTNFWSVTINQIYSNEKHFRHIFSFGSDPSSDYLLPLSRLYATWQESESRKSNKKLSIQMFN